MEGVRGRKKTVRIADLWTKIWIQDPQNTNHSTAVFKPPTERLNNYLLHSSNTLIWLISPTHTIADSMSHKITLFSGKIVVKQQLQLLNSKPTLWAACPLETDYCWKSFNKASGTIFTNTPTSDTSVFKYPNCTTTSTATQPLLHTEKAPKT
jgi:hypothetical protein